MMVLFQVFKRIFYFLRTLISKTLQIDIAYAITTHTIISNLIFQNLPAHQFHFTRFLVIRTLYLQYHFRIGDTFQQGTHLIRRFVGHIHRIDSQNAVARFQSCQSSRHPFKRLDNIDTAFFPFTDIRTDTAIFAGRHEFQFIHFLLRVVFGIRVQAA